MKLLYNDSSHSYWLDGKRVKSASKVAGIAADSFTIEQWMKRQVAIGMTLDRTLAERVAVDIDNREAQLSLRHLRSNGWSVVEVVEHWNPHAGIRQDLFGFIDVLAVKPGETLAVQTTSLAGVSARIRKIAEHPNVGAVREAGWAIHVHGWTKKAGKWVLAREVDVS